MNIKVERNYLEINSIEDLNYSQKPGENCDLKFIDPPDFQINKFFYKQIGKDHRWKDRLVWDDKNWIEYVENPKVKTYVLQDIVYLCHYESETSDSASRTFVYHRKCSIVVYLAEAQLQHARP